jgi:endonuclease/exonuclease/phosphatase family metal-dependent hydrolase
MRAMPEATVATLNLFNRDADWERRFPLVVEQLLELRPDVIGFQEIDLMLDQGMWLARRVNAGLSDRPHYRLKHAASPGKMASLHGIGTMARIDWMEHEILDLMTFERMAQRSLFQADGSPFVLVNTHLHHPIEATAERVAQLERLTAWLDERDRGLPTVVLGDFNSYVGEPAVAFMKERYRSAHEAVHGKEPDWTWTTPVNKWDNSPQGTLDYIYVSPQFEVIDAGLAFNRPSNDDPELYPSDHIGVWARLRW